MNIRQLFTLNKTDQSARELYEAAVGQARLPEFYLEMGVADTLDGRFDMIILHVYLLARRLRQDGGRNAAKLQESLFEVMFADMDRSLREMGVGDLSVGKQVKRMAKAFFGRVQVYDDVLDQPELEETALAGALARNLYRIEGEVPDEAFPLAKYVRTVSECLQQSEIETLLSGRVIFPAVNEAA